MIAIYQVSNFTLALPLHEKKKKKKDRIETIKY